MHIKPVTLGYLVESALRTCISWTNVLIDLYQHPPPTRNICFRKFEIYGFRPLLRAVEMKGLTDGNRHYKFRQQYCSTVIDHLLIES